MNIGKFRKNLKKINKFDDWSEDQEVKLTRIEKDILLEYIRKLYKAVLDENLEGTLEEPAKVLKSNEKSDNKSGPKANTFNQQRKKVEDKEQLLEEEIVIEKKPEVKKEEDISKQVTRQVEPELTKRDEIVAESPVHVSDEFRAIFNEKKSSELSEKLSMLPVSDLKKAFGLNEKIFTINELFDGDNKVFESTINDLNSLSSFTEAKDYIISNLISRFKWDSDIKIKKAEHFVKTIRRRYMN